MKKNHCLLLIIFSFFISCTGKTGVVLNIPDIEEGKALVLYSDAEQVEKGEQDTLAIRNIVKGKSEISLDTVGFESKIKDCIMLILDGKNSFVANIPLPLQKGTVTNVHVDNIGRDTTNKSTLETVYSGSEYAEDFSDFYNCLLKENIAIARNNDSAEFHYKKQAEAYKSFLEKYPSSGLAYSLLIGQIASINTNFGVNESNAVMDYCSELCLDVDKKNKWADYLCTMFRERQQRALNSSVFSFRAIDINEKEYTEKDIRNYEYLLVCFWASWSEYCLEEIPRLKKLYNQYKSKGLEILTVSIDTNPAAWFDYTRQNQFPWLSLIGNGHEITSKYDFQMIPFNMIVDKEGNVIERELFKDDIDKALKKLFNE